MGKGKGREKGKHREGNERQESVAVKFIRSTGLLRSDSRWAKGTNIFQQLPDILHISATKQEREIRKQEKKMQVKLEDAARFGKIDEFKTLISTSKQNKLLVPRISGSGCNNILHIARQENQVNIFKEAMEILSEDTKQALLADQVNSDRQYNILHYMVSDPHSRDLELLQIIVGFYKPAAAGDANDSYSKPWLARTKDDKTPLQLAFLSKELLPINYEDCVLEILSLDFDHFCTTPEYGEGGKASLLYVAVEKGFSRLALQILNAFPSSYSDAGKDGYTLLHYAPNCSEEVLELLLEKCPGMIDGVSDGDQRSVLHTWAELDNTFSKTVLDKFPETKAKLFTETIYLHDVDGRNALHRAAGRSGNNNIARILIECYQDVNAKTEHTQHRIPAWKEKDIDGDTPLLLALKSKNEELALYSLRNVKLATVDFLHIFRKRFNNENEKISQNNFNTMKNRLLSLLCQNYFG